MNKNSDPDLFVKVQKTGEIDSEKITHQPQTYRVLAAYGDWIALQGMDGGRVYFQRSTGLQRNGVTRIVEGLENVPSDYLMSDLVSNTLARLKELDAQKTE